MNYQKRTMKKKEEEENKIPVYTVTENDVYKISLVDEPAIESQMVYFKKNKPLFVAMDTDEKHMVYSAVLRPDFPIYRRYGEEEFYLVFTKEAVEKSAYDFLKNGFQHEWSVDHEEDVEGLSVVESWIKTDMENDKSIALGLDPTLEIGTWFVGLSVNNIEVWQRIKSGDFSGLSMEAFVYFDENKFSKIPKNNMKKEQNFEQVEIDETFWDKLKSIIADALKTPEVEPEVADEEADEVVEDVKEDVEVVEEMEEQVPEAEEVAEEAAADVEQVVEEAAETVEEEKDALETVIDELNAKIDELNTEIENLKKENQKLKKQPSTKSIKANAQPKGSARDTIEKLYNGTYKF
jgi:hypothetical protein